MNKEADKRVRDEIKKRFLENIAQVIKRNRHKHKMKQDSLAKALAVDRTLIAKYESGKVDIPASAMANISVQLGFPLKEYTENESLRGLCDEPEDILKVLIKINEAKRTDEIEKELRKPLSAPASSKEYLQDMTVEPRQMTIEDYMDANGQIHITPEEKPQVVRKPKKYKGYGYVTASENELMDAEMFLREQAEVMPLYKKTSVANIYQALSTQIEEAQGNDVRELAQIAKATIKYAINDVPAKKRKQIETYLDYMSDGNLAYKYGEYPEQWQGEE